jgi:DNA primase
MIPENVVDEVRGRADIVEIIGEQINLKRAGKEFRALCPFHHEKTPSFYVHPSKGFFKCFGCGESGDVFSFLMKRGGLGFQDAVKELASLYGVEIPDERVLEGDEPNKAIYEAIAFAADLFREQLQDETLGAGARAYLEKRGVSSEAAERFKIGYAPHEWRRLRDAAHKHGIEDDVLIAAGLIKESERSEEPYDRFRDRLIFPIADIGGRIVAFGGRTLAANTEGVPKYLNSPETPIYHKGEMLYGLNWSRGAIRREGAALIVEGYMDYVALASRGVENVVAGMGTALTPGQGSLLARYTGKVLLLYDSDTAGLKATFRTADALLRAGVHPLVVTLPTGEDPDSIARKGGAEGLKPFLTAAVDVMERKVAMLEERGAFHDIEGVRRALDKLLPTIRATVDPTLRDIYIARVSERTGVRRETLEEETAEPEQVSYAPRRPQQPQRRSQSGPRGGPHPKEQTYSSERLLMLLLLRNPERIGEAAQRLSEADFHDPRYRAIFEALAAGRRVEDLPDVLGPAAVSAVEEMRADPIEIIDASLTFHAAVADICVPGLFLQVQYVNDRLEKAGEDQQTELMRQKIDLQSELKKLGVDAGLGWKTSKRYREWSGTPTRRQQNPPNDEI